MLLAGVIINFFFSSLIMFLQYWSNAGDSLRIMRWLMGSLSGLEIARLADLACIVIAGAATIHRLSFELDLLSIGEELAASRGVAVRRTKIVAFAVSSVVVGAIVSLAGPIGFVGMMVPHMARLWLGWSHRLLLPASFFLGGCFLVACDLAARSLLAPAEIPIGIITALAGGPFFLWTLFTANRADELFG
jgi:iron complex transport system permease protein